MNSGAVTDPNTTDRAQPVTACPQCGAKGRKVGAQTMRSLLSAEAREHFDESDSFLFCKTQACEVVYFGAQKGDPFLETDLTVPVFQKSDDPSRLVCYCFGHTVKAVRDDALRAETANIADDITDKCRQGLDRCEEENPQGSCCLGNVRQVAKASAANIDADDPPACCCTAPEGTAKIGDEHE